MTRKLFSLATLFLCGTISFAQVLDPANRPTSALTIKKQTIINSNTRVSSSMGEMANSNNTTIKTESVVTAIDKVNGGSCETKITSVKLSVSAMGEEMSYDSENPEDGNEMLATEVKKMIRNKTIVALNNKGIITKVSNSGKSIAEASNAPGNNMEQSVGKSLNFFLDIDKPINLNDTWTDTRDKEQSLTYTYKSYDAATGIAILDCKGSIKIEEDVEQMGMTMHQSMTGDMQMTLTVDAKTLLIKKMVSTVSIKGDMEMQGQKMPMSSFTTMIDTTE
jgi:hypothetical protein